MHLGLKISLLVPILFVSVSSFAQSKLNCQIDPISGLPEATLDWQNTLGRDRADSWCRRQLMAEQVTPADVSEEVAGYVSLRGHAPGAKLHRAPMQEQVATFDGMNIPRQPFGGFAGSVGNEYVQIKPRR